MLQQLLGIRLPIIQAPMAGGGDTPELVAAVSNAGGLGSLGGAYLSPEDLKLAIRKIRSLTNQSFAVNLFAPYDGGFFSPKDVQANLDFTNNYRRNLGIEELQHAPKKKLNFEKQIEVILEESPRIFSFVFGLIPREVVVACHRHDITVIGTATSLEEAIELQDLGVDLICAQGFEAGGHRGTFFGSRDYELPLDRLLNLLRGSIEVPLIAAGGIMSGHDVLRVLDKGAIAAQLGTAFLTCYESGIPEFYKEMLLSKKTPGTRITSAFSGKRARGIENAFMQEFDKAGIHPLPFPVQNFLTQDIRAAAKIQGDPSCMSLWAGTEYQRSRRLSAKALMQTLTEEMRLETSQFFQESF